MNKAYKYRIYPNEEQKIFFEKSFGCVRYIYNYALEAKISHYKIHKDDKDKKTRSLSTFEISRRIPGLKKENEWLKEPNSGSLIFGLRNLESAYKKFWREKKGFPKFKSKHDNNQSFSVQEDQIKIDGNKIHLGKVKDGIKCVFHRPLVGVRKTTTFSKTPSGKYYVSFVAITKDEFPPKPEFKEDTTIGIDVGLKTFAVMTEGENIENPKFLQKSEKRLAMLQRRLSRKKKGSNNRVKAKLKVAKLHNRIANQRSNFLHNLTYNLTHKNQVDSIAIEDLNIKGMVRNHHLAKAISSVSWSEFRRQLTYKCDWYGKNLLVIPRFAPSSKMCSCGYLNKELTLAEREWTCPECKTTHDRDLNAANNIKKFALANLSLNMGATPKIKACGEKVVRRSVKQELSQTHCLSQDRSPERRLEACRV